MLASREESPHSSSPASKIWALHKRCQCSHQQGHQRKPCLSLGLLCLQKGACSRCLDTMAGMLGARQGMSFAKNSVLRPSKRQKSSFYAHALSHVLAQ